MAYVLSTCCIVAFAAQVTLGVPSLSEGTIGDLNTPMHSGVSNQSAEIDHNEMNKTATELEIEDRFGIDNKNDCAMNMTIITLGEFVNRNKTLKKRLADAEYDRRAIFHLQQCITRESTPCFTHNLNNLRYEPQVVCVQDYLEWTFEFFKTGDYQRSSETIYLPCYCSCMYIGE